MRVRVEHLELPLGIGDRRPRLSWMLPDGSSRQHGYELRLDDGTTTGRIDSSENVLVAWPGRPLASRERREVQVRVWTDLGVSAWSEATAVEAGLLEPSDWVSSWVQPVEHAPYEPGFRPAYLLRGEATIDKPVSSARLHATAQGLYEAHLNGHRVGDLELTPGFTEYAERTQVQTFDVSDLVVAGSNALGAVLADGWYRGEVGMLRSYDQFGERTAFLAQLHVDHPDGTTTVVGTGEGWTSRPSHILSADLIEGQTEDRRLAYEGWAEPAYDGAGWDRATVVAAPRPEHQRARPAHRPRPCRHHARAHARGGTRVRRRRDDRAPEAG